MRIPHVILLLASLAGVPGCVETAGPGPDLGDCAEIPDDYQFGRAGIGSCLSGPTDLQFVQRDGGDWLAVSNADQFQNFSGGSVLLIDWDSVLEGIAQSDDSTLFMHELDTLALKADDPATASEEITDHFVGGLGWIADRSMLLATRRLTVDGRTRTGRDSAYVFDVETGALSTQGSRLQLEDDPGDIVVASDGRVFVLNYSDHSISVFDSVGDGPLLPIDIAQEASIAAHPLVEADERGAVAQIERITVLDSTLLTDDDWTVSYLPGQFRIWVPGPEATLDMWSTGGDGWVTGGIDNPVDLGFLGGGATDFVTSFQVVQTDGLPTILEMLYVDGNTVLSMISSGTVDGWTVDPTPRVTPTDGWDAFIRSPSRAGYNEGDAIYYQGSATEGGPASVGVAVLAADGTFVNEPAPLLSPPPGHSYEFPFVQLDIDTNNVRMWLSIHDGTDYRIAYSESDTGEVFTEPEVAPSLPAGLSAPVVRHQNGRYHLFAAQWTGDHWRHVHGTSFDGFNWGPLELILDNPEATDPRDPPRLAVDGTPSGRWSVEGIDNGMAPSQVFPGQPFIDAQRGYTLAVTAGQEFPRDQLFPLGRASSGVVPTSVVGLGSVDRLFVTIIDDSGRERIAAVDYDPITDSYDVANPDIIGRNQGGNVLGVRSPLVVQRDGRFVMFYSAISSDGQTRIRLAHSDDGRQFEPIDSLLLDGVAGTEWLGAEQEAHSLEVDADGTVRLFISGYDGSRWRIGAVVSSNFDGADPAAANWAIESDAFDESFQLGSGAPGGVDDSGVKDPSIVVTPTDRLLYYSAFDGLVWRLARAEWVGGQWVPHTIGEDDGTLPSMSGLPRTFSAGGVYSPVVRSLPGGQVELWYAGVDLADGGIPQVGYGQGRGVHLFAHQRLPGTGDALAYTTRRGDETVSVIELAQNTASFFTSGTGTTSMVLDEQRGFLYVPSKLSDLLYVVDIRDDSREGFVDRNVYDLETVVQWNTLGNQGGFRGGVVLPGQDRALFTTRDPEGVISLDLSAIEDDGDKETTRLAFATALPMRDTRRDRGGESVAFIGGAEPTLYGDLLFVPHFRDNSMSVFDLSLGPAGEEIAYTPYLGENPHQVAISPDGRYAVVAVYTGDVYEAFASSTLALIDLDPDSPDYLQATHWLRNRFLDGIVEGL